MFFWWIFAVFYCKLLIGKYLKAWCCAESVSLIGRVAHFN